MKLVIEKEKLADLLANTAAATASKDTIAILQTFKLVADGDSLSITATNTEIEAEADAPAEVTRRGACCPQAGRLQALVATLPDGSQVELEADDPIRLRLRCGRTSATIPCLPAEDFPAMRLNSGGSTIRLPAVTLASIFDRARFSISTETTRYYLCGICFQADGASGPGIAPPPPGFRPLVAVATNGHTLTRVIVQDQAPADWPSSILPGASLKAIERIIKGAGEVEIAANPSGMIFRADRRRVTTKVIDGTFPDFRRVIPAHQRAAAIGAGELASALGRVRVATRGSKSDLVVFTLKDNGLTLSGRSEDGAWVEEDLECAAPFYWPGGVKGEYLDHLLTALDTTQLTVQLGGVGDPMALFPAGHSCTWTTPTLCVLMPMRVGTEGPTT